MTIRAVLLFCASVPKIWAPALGDGAGNSITPAPGSSNCTQKLLPQHVLPETPRTYRSRGLCCSRLPAQFRHSAYSALFLRRSTMIPRNRTASTAQTTRTVEPSIVLSPFLTRMYSALLDLTFREVLDVLHHRYQFPHDLHHDRTHGDHKQGRQDAKEDGEDQFYAQLGGLLLGNLTRLHTHEV